VAALDRNIGNNNNRSASKAKRTGQQRNTLSSSIDLAGGEDLIAARKQGGDLVALRVHIVLDGKPFRPTKFRNIVSNASSCKSSSRLLVDRASAKKDKEKVTTTTFLGQDGNLFYCGVCQGFGDVVCCDGCPAVFHPSCLPRETPSRMSLDNDDDPWYCPDCMSKKSPAKEEEGRPGGRRAIKHRCQECRQTRPDLSLQPCKVCGVWIHHPSCRGTTPPSEMQASKATLCSSCRAEAALTEEELELHAKKKQRREEDAHEAGDLDTPTRTAATIVDLEEFGDDQPMAHDVLDAPGSENDGIGKKRKRCKESSLGDLTTTEKMKKKKKKKRRQEGHHANDESPSKVADGSSPHSVSAPHDEGSPFGAGAAAAAQGHPTQATPAFHFYLVEQRPKVEKVLGKKHPFFLRLPKGGKRNALIAKETAKQWIKLSSVDQKKYIEMSMRDYENRIIRWKAEKNIQAMTAGEAEGVPEPVDEMAGEVQGPNDGVLTYEMHERLYKGTAVGSKPYKPEPNQSHNRVLLDLLRDMRFHPLPLFCVSRPDVDLDSAGSLSYECNSCIRHFDVHGPIATSVGDECLGCTRGWPHFCPVLQRRIPAVGHRSGLQPAASALISLRVGLGLRPRMERAEIDEEGNHESCGDGSIFRWKGTKEEEERKRLRFVPSGTLSNPSQRADDIVEFIEEVVAMKIPEPSRPSPPLTKNDSSPRKPLLGRGLLPTRQKRVSESDAIDNCVYESINKCGRCRTIIMDDKGCVQCRRAQLVINMSRRLPSAAPEERQKKQGPWKVQTVMLGRVITKEAIGEVQAESDKAISAALLKQRWTPCAVLPPTKTLAPSPSRKTVVRNESVNPEDSQIKTGGQEVPDIAISNDDNQCNRVAEEPGNSQVKDDISSELRPRNARRAANTPSSLHNEDIERQIVAKQHREEAEKLQKRCLSVACSGILLALIRRDPLLLFAQPVAAEGYSQVVRTPIDFGVIRKRVLKGSYHTLGAFMADARLLCENALIFNPPGSVYWKTAKELVDLLPILQKRGNKWMNAIKNVHSSAWRKSPKKRESDGPELTNDTADTGEGDPFKVLRKTWPEAAEMYENMDLLKKLLTADFARTKENETAFYGSLAVRRAAKAAEVCLAPYPDTGAIRSAIVKRSHLDDEDLRNEVDQKVSDIIDPVQLRDIASGREETIVRLMRHVQTRRLERRIGSDNGCARCDGMGVGLDQEMKAVMNADVRLGRQKKRGDVDVRVAQARLDLTTGLASKATRDWIENRRAEGVAAAFESANDVCVSLRGSRIHGLGLYSEQSFEKGEVVAEYLGECITLPVAEAREKVYQAMRIQDYQFRLDDSQIIDATMKGGLGRYVNHNCNPNCVTKIMGKPPLRRVLILAQRDIEPREELTYDYQFPLELNLKARIPCNCQSEICRGFMNWDLPEKGANTGALRTQKR